MSETRKQKLPSLNTDLENNALGDIYQVIKEFNARLEDELSLKLGDKVALISDDKEFNDGWYMGKSLSTGAVGLYPKDFTKLVPSLSRPTLLRSRSRIISSPTSGQSPLSLKNSANVTPTSVKASRFDEKVTPVQDTTRNNQLTGALSDIDKALEELKMDVKPIDTSFTDTIESLNPETVESWTPEQVTTYFKYLGFDEKSSEQFVKHKITGSILLELELAYLKELDIASFGTRFEIYKEIEALKELAEQKKLENQHHYEQEAHQQDQQQQQQDQHTFDEEDEFNISNRSLLAAPEVHRKESTKKTIEEDLEAFTRPLGHTRRKSKSLEDIPEKNHSYKLKNRTSFVPPSQNVPDLPIETNEQFLSPRRAPQPPSYPSPIQLRQDEPFSNQNTPIINRSSHSRKPSYDVNPAFQFKNHSRKSSLDPGSHSKQNSRSFIKSASTADLLTTGYVENGRPASSIYDFSHSRHSSVNLKNNNTNINNNNNSNNNNSNNNINSRRHSRHFSDLSTRKEKEEKQHRRHSSVFSFLSASNNFNSGTGNISPTRQTRPNSVFGLISPSKQYYDDEETTPTLDPKASFNKRRSVSAKDAEKDENEIEQDINLPIASPTKRSVSEAVRHKTLRNISSSTTLKKTKTSAFMEGIRNINPSESIKSADCFGWMNKRGGIAVGSWKQRYFTLHGTRLSYFTSLSDSRERGLIDITSHKVLPARDDDKFVSLYAATTGHGKFCFKLVPPAPGSRKGLTFTQPKVHYFAVETREEMRTWMAALIKATIDIDESVPVLSSCATPTVSLQKAQILLAQARENAKKREELKKKQLLEKPDLSGNSSISPDTDSFDSNQLHQSPNTTVNTETPIITDNGFGSPFELAMFTPKSTHSNSTNNSPIDTEFKSKPYTTAVRHPSNKRSVNNPSAAAAQAALNGSYKSGNNRL